jgi:hypothetical protein
MKYWLARAARTRIFRLAVAVAFLLTHLLIAVRVGKDFGFPFNMAPGKSPYFVDPAHDGAPYLWDRLVISRWDSLHYMHLALHGYSTCPKPPIADLQQQHIGNCQLSFYPGYPFIGRLLSLNGRFPIDYVLFGVALVASAAFLYLWTDEVMQRALGTLGCYLSLLAFNVFPSAFALVTVQTEPLVLASTLGAFVALERRRPNLGAVLAGVAAGIRVTGAAASAAYSLALLASLYSERRLPSPREALATLVRIVVSAWGLWAMMTYHWYRFHDPLLYVHGHAAAFGHQPSLLELLHPSKEIVLRSITDVEHEGVWVALALLWLLLGGRAALSGFTFTGKAFMVGLTVATLGISMPGSVGLAFAGMNRYLLLVFPMFFAIAKLGRRAAPAFAFWLVICGWNYLNVTMDRYIGHSPFLTNWSTGQTPFSSGAPPTPKG